MYGVGYPVMYKATAGQYALWFLIVLAFAKIAACSLTIGIGGSGGIFAPSLFIGVTSGMAYGEIVHHIFGPAAGQPALYAVVAMGAVFASAARAPLTSLASVVEMTGDFALTLPVMLAVAIASTLSRALSYGTIYTTKLLRRGTDIDRTTPWRALADLKIADAMRPFRPPLPVPPTNGDRPVPDRAALPGPVIYQADPQALFATESVAQALRPEPGHAMLTLTTGALDAVSYLRLGKVFSSVITGNLALLGVATGQHDAMLALNAGLALAGYACGVLAGGTFAGTPERGQPAWPAGGSRLAMLLLGAAAMGMQSTAVRRLGPMSTTYLTSTLTGVLSALAIRRWPAEWQRSTGVILAAVIGATLGGLAALWSPGWVPAAILVPITAVLAGSASLARCRLPAISPCLPTGMRADRLLPGRERHAAGFSADRPARTMARSEKRSSFRTGHGSPPADDMITPALLKAVPTVPPPSGPRRIYRSAISCQAHCFEKRGDDVKRYKFHALVTMGGDDDRGPARHAGFRTAPPGAAGPERRNRAQPDLQRPGQLRGRGPVPATRPSDARDAAAGR